MTPRLLISRYVALPSDVNDRCELFAQLPCRHGALRAAGGLVQTTAFQPTDQTSRATRKSRPRRSETARPLRAARRPAGRGLIQAARVGVRVGCAFWGCPRPHVWRCLRAGRGVLSGSGVSRLSDPWCELHGGVPDLIVITNHRDVHRAALARPAVVDVPYRLRLSTAG